MTGESHEENILVLAKTYPETSEKYGLLVCVAGINEAGEWRRIYPVPYLIFYDNRYKDIRFKKFDMINVKLKKSPRDHREESYKIIYWEKINVLDNVRDWNERREIIKKYLDPGFNTLKKEGRSLGIIKPRKVYNFLVKKRVRLRGDREVLDRIQRLLPEYTGGSALPKFRPAKIPWIGYKYKCYDPDCRGHEMMCIDWEIQELYRKIVIKDKDSFEKVRQKAFNWMMNERDLYFVVGTTWRYSRWMVIGALYPPKETTNSLSKYLKK